MQPEAAWKDDSPTQPLRAAVDEPRWWVWGIVSFSATLLLTLAARGLLG